MTVGAYHNSPREADVWSIARKAIDDLFLTEESKLLALAVVSMWVPPLLLNLAGSGESLFDVNDVINTERIIQTGLLHV